MDGLFDELARTPEGEHRDVGGVAAKGDGDQRGPDAFETWRRYLPVAADVGLGIAVEVRRSRPRA